MKKFLTFVLVLAMVMSVSGVALAAFTGATTQDSSHVVYLNDGTNTCYYASLQAAIDDAQNNTGNVTITFLTDITQSVIVTQKEGLNLTIDGAGKKMTNASIEIYGKARYNGAETLTIKNIVFDVNGAAMDCIHCNTTESEKRYAHNVTIQGCTFDFEDCTDAVATRFRQCYNIVIDDCEMIGGHSLMWSTGGFGTTIKDTTVDGAQNGISLGTTTPCEISGCSIDVEGNNGYGIRADGSSATSITIKDSDIEAEKPVIVRKATGTTNLDISDSGNSFTPTGSDGAIVLTTGADDAPVVPPNAGAVTTTGDLVAKNGDTYYTNADTAKNEAKPEDTVYPVQNGVVNTSAPIKTPDPSAAPTTTTSSSGYSGPDLWYIGGNTFGTSTTQSPSKVEIDGVAVPFTMNGSKIVVGCVDPNANWVTVRWGSTTNTVHFTPDAQSYCTQTVIPKTGDMPIWAAIAAFFGF